MRLSDLLANGATVISGASIGTLPLSPYTAQGASANTAYAPTLGLSRSHRETALNGRPAIHGQYLAGPILFGAASRQE